MWVGVDIVGLDTVGVDVVGRAVQGFRIARELASMVDVVCSLQRVQHINANLCILHGPGRNVHHRYTRGARVAQVLVGMFGLWSLSVSDQHEPRVAEVWTGGRAVLVPIRYGINDVSHTWCLCCMSTYYIYVNATKVELGRSTWGGGGGGGSYNRRSLNRHHSEMAAGRKNHAMDHC